jgi:ubiquinone/menaquinone biosynthesis C-methylase UbiE
MQDNTHESVQDYYGKELKTSADLKTNACCTAFDYPQKIKNILSEIHDEVLMKYYGCGLTIPEELHGLKILDLGSGSGRDCYLASKLVGEDGYVIGVDMTDEQLEVANKHIDYHTEKFGYKKPNIEFKKGHIEQLDELDIQNDSLDLIISNCVINLSTNKKKVLQDCYNKLKQGSEMYFSDVYVNKRIPSDLAKDPVVYGECLGGALYWNDFFNFAKEVGFADPRIVESAPITIENKELEERLKGYEFYSVTFRLFKIDELEKDSEDYGQAVVYNGDIENSPESFLFDEDNTFEKGKAKNVCANTFLMLEKSRYNKHFQFIGNKENHFGLFTNTSKANPFAELHKQEQPKTSGCC